MQMTATEQEKKYQLIVVLIYISVLFLDRMDVTIVNVAMPTFAHVFGVNVTDTEWIATGFLLALALIIPISGWLSNRFGIKKVFIFAVSMFTLGSLLSALAWSLSSLVFFRVIQGIGGGVLLPVGMALTYRTFPRHQFAKVANYTLMPTLTAPAIAPAVGGFLLTHASWHYLFLINVPVGLGALVLSIYHLKEDRVSTPPPLDVKGFVLSACALTLLLYIISRTGHMGFYDPIVQCGFVAFLILTSFFIYHEKRAEHPLIDMKFFKIPLFVQANLMQLCLQICYFGSVFLIALYFQIHVGMNPMESGLSMLAQPLGTILMLPVSARVFNRFGPKYSMIFGMFGLALTTLSILFVKRPSEVMLASALMFVRGLVIGCVNGPIQASSMLEIQKEDTASASAIFSAGRQVAISLGIALSSMLLSWQFSFTNVFFVIALVAVCGGMIAMTVNNQKIRSKIKQP